MRKRRSTMDDDSVTKPGAGAPEKMGKPGRPRGEDERKANPEPGRQDAPRGGPTKRPRGTSSARDTTSIDPQEPLDPQSPNLR